MLFPYVDAAVWSRRQAARAPADGGAATAMLALAGLGGSVLLVGMVFGWAELCLVAAPVTVVAVLTALLIAYRPGGGRPDDECGPGNGGGGGSRRPRGPGGAPSAPDWHRFDDLRATWELERALAGLPVVSRPDHAPSAVRPATWRHPR